MSATEERYSPTPTMERSKTQNTSEPLGPLDFLPQELWSRICYFAVVCPDPIELTTCGCCGKEFALPHCHQAAYQQPAITRVCKLFREEALPMFYTMNIFVVVEPKGEKRLPVREFRQWLRCIGPINRRLVKSIVLQTEWLWDRTDMLTVDYSIRWAEEWRGMRLVRVTKGEILGRKRSVEDQIYRFVLPQRPMES
jgi:hypothetical protein